MAEKFGRYWLHDRIGQGGMAEVFRATMGPDPNTYAFELALKRLHAKLEKDQSQVDSFLTEADVAKFLHHPNLVRVYEAGLQEGRAYIAMEYVWGHDLSRLLRTARERQQPVPGPLAIYLTLQLLRAVDYVHRAKSAGGVAMDLVHRDVTPANIYVTFRGEVKLGDFGVVRVGFLESSEESQLIKGKVAYMPPEVLDGEPVDQGMDLWGVAATLYELVTLRQPYDGLSEEELIGGARPAAILPAHKAQPGVDAKLSAILARGLNFNRRKRPKDALILYQDLKLYLRSLGVRLENGSVARWLQDVMGPQTAEERATQPGNSDFVFPDYQVPVGASPTQRFELVRRRRRTFWIPLIVGGAVLAGGASGFGVYLIASAMHPHGGGAVVTSDKPESTGTPAQAGEATAVASGSGAVAAESTAAGQGGLVTPSAGAANLPGAAATGQNSTGKASAPALAPLAEEKIKDANARFKALMQRGRNEAKRGDQALAAQAFAAALASKPNQQSAQFGLATALLSLKKFAESEQVLNALIDAQPRNANAYLLLGYALQGKGEKERAGSAFRRCLAVEPKGKFAKAARKALDDLK